MALSSQGSLSLMDNTFGALLLSTFIALPLYGLTLAQTTRYASLYQSDRRLLKTLVGAIFISDTLHSASIIHICYHYLVADSFTPVALFVNVWTVNLFPLSMGITVLLAQGFYAQRIHVVAGANCKYRILVLFVVLLLSVEFGFMMASSIVSFRSASFEVLGHYTWMNTSTFAIATIVDLVLTGAFVTIMRQSRTGFLRTDAALNLLARYAVFATALVSTLAIAAFIFSLVLWNSFVYIAISSPAAKVYANSVLSVLNCRNSLSSPGDVSTGLEMESLKLSALRGRGTLQRADGRGGARAAAGTALSDVVLDISAAEVRTILWQGGQPECGGGLGLEREDRLDRAVMRDDRV